MWAQLWKLLESALLLSLEKGLKLLLFVNDFISRVVAGGLVKCLPCGCERLLLLVPLLNLLVVLEVGEELAPRDELLVIDGVLLLRQLHHLVHLISLNLVEDLVEREDLALLAGDADGLGIDEVDNFHIHSQVLDILSPLEDAILILVEELVLLLHGLDLRWQKEHL